MVTFLTVMKESYAGLDDGEATTGADRCLKTHETSTLGRGLGNRTTKMARNVVMVAPAADLWAQPRRTAREFRVFGGVDMLVCL